MIEVRLFLLLQQSKSACVLLVSEVISSLFFNTLKSVCEFVLAVLLLLASKCALVFRKRNLKDKRESKLKKTETETATS